MAITTMYATVNGIQIPLRLQSDGTYRSETAVAPNFSTNNSISAPLGFVPVSIKAVDDAGNEVTVDYQDSTFGSDLRLYIKEENKPTITFSSPSASSYHNSKNVSIGFKVVDNVTMTTGYSGINPDSIEIKDGNTTLSGTITKSSVTGGYNCTYAGVFEEGVHNITVTARDNDGNTQTSSVLSFEVDLTFPVLDVYIDGKTGDNIITNKTQLVVSGSTDNQEIKKNVTVTISVNDADQGAIDVQNDGSFSKTINIASEGEYTFIIRAVDQAGNKTERTKTVKIVTTGPRFKNITMSPNPAFAGKAYDIIVEMY